MILGDFAANTPQANYYTLIAGDPAASTEAAPHGRDVLVAALARLGLAPPLTEVLTAAARFDESAMAVVSLIDTGVSPHVHPRVLTIADTDYGRLSITTSASADGREWMTIWPTTPAGLRDDLAALLAVPQAA
jgi:hypothetical protein